jgi:dTDP-4-dehydrorhamnose 3,5-epimerase
MVEIRPLRLDGALEIRPRKFGDDRGFFSETWSQKSLAEAGVELNFVQDNHSFSAARGVLRGMHYQLPPSAQEKLVRVSRGAIYDVLVDIRRGSPTFGQWEGVIVSVELWNQILVPKGFAHGFVTLEPNTEVQYKVTAFYDAESDRGIAYDDPAIGIEWPVDPAEIQLSAKDKAAPRLADIDTGFDW